MMENKQRRNDQRSIRWFLKELGFLENEGILQQDAAKKLSDYYHPKMVNMDPLKMALNIIAIIAAVLIAGGVILLAAYNWSGFSKPVKSVFAILITLLPQLAILILMLQKKEVFNPAVRESLAAGLSIAFGGSIAFIGQIYQLPENTMLFISVWCLSTLILAYLFHSYSALTLYFFLTVVHTTVFQNDSDFHMGFLFIPMILITVPFYLLSLKKSSPEQIIYQHYLLAAALVSGLGISFEKIVPGTWIIGYSSLFVVFYLVSILTENPEDPMIRSPFKVTAIAGMFIFSYLLTFEGFWNDIGWDFIRTGEKFTIQAGIYDLLVILFLMILQIAAAVRLVIRKETFNIIFTLYGLLVAVLFVLGGFHVPDLALSWIVNGYILFLCIYSIIYGIRHSSLLTINLSALFLTITIVTRFFNDDTLFLVRGIIFILCGLGLLGMNLLISKSFKHKGDARE
jgi:uncharacterized membrane protein